MRFRVRGEGRTLSGWAVIVVAVACAGAAVACGRGAEDESATGGISDRLERLIEQYVRLQRQDPNRDEILDLSAGRFVQDTETRRQLLQEIQAIDPGELALEEIVDQRLLIGLLESDIRAAETRPVWKNAPALYVPSARIARLLESQAPGSAAERADQLVALLGQLPAMLGHARQNLDRPPRRFTEAAIFQTHQSIDSLGEQVRTLADAAGAAGESLLAASGSAVGALEAHAQFLQQDLLPRSDGDWAIGRVEYDYILQHRWFLDDDVDSILQRGRRAFEETEALAQEVAERIDPGKHWVQVYEHLKDDHPAADSIKHAYQQQMDAARAFLIEHRVVTLPPGERVITVDTPPAMRRSSPFGTFETVGPFDQGLQGRLVLTPIEGWMSPEQRAERLRSHHRAWIPIIAVHEAYPGHHVHALKTNENPRILRRIVRESIFAEGWGLFTEQLMFELGFLQGDDVQLTQLRNRLWRAARVILDVSLHTGQMSLDEAVEFLVQKVRFERYAAELEVGMYPRRPTYVLGYLIGMQEIAALRDDYIEAFGEPQPPSELYDRLLRIGAIPPALVRVELFGHDGPWPE